VTHQHTLPRTDGEPADGTGSQEVPERPVADMSGQSRDRASQQKEAQETEPIYAQGHNTPPAKT